MKGGSERKGNGCHWHSISNSRSVEVEQIYRCRYWKLTNAGRARREVASIRQNASQCLLVMPRKRKSGYPMPMLAMRSLVECV